MQIGQLMKKDDFQETCSDLLIASLRLTLKDATKKQLEQFINTALALYNLYKKINSTKESLNVLFWLRKRLIKEAKSSTQSAPFKTYCLQEADKIERKIAMACVRQSKLRLTMLE